MLRFLFDSGRDSRSRGGMSSGSELVKTQSIFAGPAELARIGMARSSGGKSSTTCKRHQLRDNRVRPHRQSQSFISRREPVASSWEIWIQSGPRDAFAFVCKAAIQDGGLCANSQPHVPHGHPGLCRRIPHHTVHLRRSRRNKSRYFRQIDWCQGGCRQRGNAFPDSLGTAKRHLRRANQAQEHCHYHRQQGSPDGQLDAESFAPTRCQGSAKDLPGKYMFMPN